MLNDDVQCEERIKRGMIKEVWVIVNEELVLKSANVSEKSRPPFIKEMIEKYELKMPCAFGVPIETPSLCSKNFKKAVFDSQKERKKENKNKTF